MLTVDNLVAEAAAGRVAQAVANDRNERAASDWTRGRID
jgi:hypothetical protein